MLATVVTEKRVVKITEVSEKNIATQKLVTTVASSEAI